MSMYISLVLNIPRGLLASVLGVYIVSLVTRSSENTGRRMSQQVTRPSSHLCIRLGDLIEITDMDRHWRVRNSIYQ